MREVNVKQIKEKVKELFLEANYCIGKDVLNSIKEASLKETSETGKNALSMILQNYKVAAEEKFAICQDTGLAILFIKLGQEVHVSGNWEEAIKDGVKEAMLLSLP